MESTFSWANFLHRCQESASSWMRYPSKSWTWWRLPFLHPKNYGPSYMGLPEELEDIRLLLDQRSEAEVNVGGQSVICSVHDERNAQIESSFVTVRVEAKISIAIMRPEGVAQGGHAGEGQQRLGGAAWGKN
ncbi:hypothetical protein GOBAR_AA20821 [Gossypium barbadense]|uniref:Uncharacterized protein n=1 Tax=Gossypium barbadense TaxID=3634 RepID=A0A2P5X940_GOSBA|nr:hypothetical protein GOBAR_AA20821 [Gossypium barbadense]